MKYENKSVGASIHLLATKRPLAATRIRLGMENGQHDYELSKTS